MRSAALTGYAELAQSLGLDPHAQLRAAGLDLACLNQPDLHVPIASIHNLLEASALAAGIEDFGLRLAAARRLSNLGPIALAAREEPTVRDAMLCLHRTLHMHNDALRIDMDEGQGIAVVSAHVLALLHGTPRQGIELIVGVMSRVVRDFIGERWLPRSVCFMHAAPHDMAPYRRVFGVTPPFNSVLNGITCRSEDLAQPMPGADAESLRTIRQCIPSAAEQDDTYTERTVRLILRLLPAGRCCVDLVARQLGVDRRSLHRRLEVEGTTFTRLLDEFCQEAALRHIDNPARSVTELASMLGFSDASTFSHWFSRRFGQSPLAWRARRHLPGQRPK